MRAFAVVVTGPAVTSATICGVSAAIHEVGHFDSQLSEPNELGHGHAVEWSLRAGPDDAARVLGHLRAKFVDGTDKSHLVDINLVEDGPNRRKKLLIADMDSTIIEQECIDEIADLAGHGPAVSAITEQAMRGELDFEEALRHRVALLAGLDSATLERVVSERLTISSGAYTLVKTMRANGAYCALVSGGFTFFTNRIATHVGFNEDRANTLEIKDDCLTGRPIPPILGAKAKLDALRDIMAKNQVEPDATLAVGDGANDLSMIKAASLGVAYRAKPIVAAKAAARIDHGDLTALLYLQGYHHSEFSS